MSATVFEQTAVSKTLKVHQCLHFMMEIHGKNMKIAQEGSMLKFKIKLAA